MKKFFLFAFALPLLLGCKKESDPIATKRDALTKAAWIQTALTVSPALNGQTDYFNGLDACTKDDLYRYTSDGKYTGDEGASKCTTTAPQLFFEGTWRLTQDEQRLVLEYTEIGANNQRSALQTVVREVVGITDLQLDLRYRITDPNTGTAYTVSETYQPKP